jgi:hypothetical protein
MLADYSADILTDIVSEYSTEVQEHISWINNFYCKLIFLSGLADAAETSLKIW